MLWPFGKKKKDLPPIENTVYTVSDRVYFVHRGDRTYGKVYRVYSGENGSILYDVQVGGQCPYIKYGMKEEELKPAGSDLAF